MKIGLLTFHYANNYGALLQTYALSTVLQRRGHEVRLINLRPAPVRFKYHLRQLLRRNRHHFSENMLPGVEAHFRHFEASRLPPATPVVYSSSELTKLSLDFDAVVVGSDQVWRPRYTRPNAETYFLDFVPSGVKKIAYAASFGVDRWEEEFPPTSRMLRLMKEFNAISVREHSGISICRDVFGVKATQVLDPTLLVSPDTYHGLLAGGENLKEPGLVYFKLDRDADSLKSLERLRRECALEPVFVGEKSWSCFGIRFVRGYDSMGKWLARLQSAGLVLTDSFHAVCFSLIFRRNFICYSNAVRGRARLESLLEPLGLENRLCSSYEELAERRAWTEDIDYDRVWTLLDRQREHAMNFLATSLEA